MKSGTLALLLAALLALLLAGCYADLDWRKLAPEEGRFEVLMPARSQSESRVIADGATMTQWTAATRDALFGVAYTDYPGGAATHLNAARDALALNIGGALVEDRTEPIRPRTEGISESRAVTIQGATPVPAGKAARPLTVHARFHVRGERLYRLAVIARTDAVTAADLDMFFSSFETR